MKTKKILKHTVNICGTYKRKYKGGAAASDDIIVQLNKQRRQIDKLLKNIDNYEDPKDNNLIIDQLKTVKMLLIIMKDMIDNINSDNITTLQNKLKELKTIKNDFSEIMQILIDSIPKNLKAEIPKLKEFIEYGKNIIKNCIPIIDTRLFFLIERLASKFANENNNAKPVRHVTSERLASKFANENNNAKPVRPVTPVKYSSSATLVAPSRPLKLERNKSRYVNSVLSSENKPSHRRRHNWESIEDKYGTPASIFPSIFPKSEQKTNRRHTSRNAKLSTKYDNTNHEEPVRLERLSRIRERISNARLRNQAQSKHSP